MGNTIDKLGATFYYGIIQTAEVVGKGVLVTSEAMHDVFTIEGFKNFSKAALSIMDLPAYKTVFSAYRETLKGHKDILYVTDIFSAFGHYVAPDKKDPKKYVFTIPKKTEMNEKGEKIESIDYKQIFYDIGSVLEVGKFFQTYKIFSMAWCTRFADTIGSVPIYGWVINEFSLVASVLEFPKGLFIGLASTIELTTVWSSKDSYFIKALKVASNAGKIILISFGSKVYKEEKLLGYVAVAAFGASFVSFLIKQHKARQTRLGVPVQTNNGPKPILKADIA